MKIKITNKPNLKFPLVLRDCTVGATYHAWYIDDLAGIQFNDDVGDDVVIFTEDDCYEIVP